MSGTPFIVSAPSGAGKTTLCRMLTGFFGDMRDSVSYTTREQRPGEEDGIDYRFVDDDAFESMAAANEFLEHADVFGKRYGTSGRDLERLLDVGFNVLLEVDVQGAEKIRKNLGRGVYIFILPPSIETCRKRLIARGKDSATEIERRLGIAAQEIKHAPGYDYIIINDDLDAAFDTLKTIVLAETDTDDEAAEKAAAARKDVMMEKVEALFGEE
jgi:guanylate kinase